MPSKARQIHKQAEQARENGDFVEALKLTDEAMVAYQESGDTSGLAEVQSSRFLTLRHLYEQTNDKNYLTLAKYTVQAAIEIAQKSDNKKALAIPLFNLAKAQEILGELSSACVSYQAALDNITTNPPEEHARPAVVADFKIHLYTCQYLSGEKSALEKAEQALSELAAADEAKYNKDVWLSGAHMRIVEMLHADNPEKAREHLQKAKEIIDSNPDLKLRLKQWEKLAQTFN